MRSLACLVVFVIVCLAIPGCAAFNKKTNDSKTPGASQGGGAPPAKFPTNADPLINGSNAPQAYGGAVLAGRVIDNFSKPPANTSIRLVSMDAKETSNRAEVNVTPEGYFTIQGLKSGASYKLVAQGKNGDHMLAGMTYTRAPNLTVVIQVKEGAAAAMLSDGAGSAPSQDNKPGATSEAEQPNNLSNANNATPSAAQAGNDVIIPPLNVPSAGPLAPPLSPANKGWVPAPSVASDQASAWPPMLDIPNPTVKPAPPPLLIPRTTTPPPPPYPPSPAPAASRLDGPARVPSCVLIGNTLVNFALKDVSGEAWEFKRNRRGKLLLIDFWSTSCQPCIKTIPDLVNLQRSHDINDLEVVGIAVESGGNPQEQAYRVTTAGTRLGVNYRQLLSTSPNCPVCRDFGIEYFPTMVLVDQNGVIIWKHKGKPERDELAVLERIIRSRLTNR